jgi:ubiquinone/menaquinone biosynthesis C-methylase UbiE
VGIDADRGAVAIARRRAARMRLQDRVRFIAAPAEQLEDHFRPASVDVVLHTLVGNNLDERDDAAHYRAVARVMKPRGLLVASMRTVGREENLAPGRVVPPPALRRYFRLTPGVTTQLAEHGGFSPPYARVALWVGRRR